MSVNPFIAPAPIINDTWMWANVTQLSPLRIRFDGEATSVDATPDTLVAVASLAVGTRVWVQLSGKSMVILGKSGG
jgi:hypothetical protein